MRWSRERFRSWRKAEIDEKDTLGQLQQFTTFDSWLTRLLTQDELEDVVP